MQGQTFEAEIDILGRAPSLDDQEGTWEDVFGIERDDTYRDIDEIIEGEVLNGRQERQGCYSGMA